MDSNTDVTITLTARNPAEQFVVPQRQIKLTKQNPFISIGRASKVPSKGFLAARENAWFESPVMSRQHAEVIVDFDVKIVSIKDVGSLHGTFHRGVDNLEKENRLRTDELVKLSDGDRIRFGTDIYRSHDTFPPCTVDVKVKWIESATKPSSTTALSTSTFAVPEEDYLSSDDEDYSIMDTDKPLPAQVAANETIDLTRRDDTPNSPTPLASAVPVVVSSNMASTNVHSDIIDLTSEPDVDVASKRVNGNNSYGDLSDGELSDNDHSDYADDSSSSSSLSYYFEKKSHAIGGYSRSPSVLKCGTDLHSDVEGSLAENSEMDLSDADEDSIILDGDSAEILFSDDDVDAAADDENIAAIPRCDVDESVDEHATTGDFQEGEESDIHDITYFDDMTSNSDSEEEREAADNLNNFSTGVDSPATSPLTAPPAKMDDFYVPAASGTTCPTTVTTKVWTNPTYQGYTATRDRQPSPSDAAMVKYQPLFGHPLFAYTAKSTAQVLGERTGNYDFWAARDHNRAIAMGDSLASASRPTLAAEKPFDEYTKGVEETTAEAASLVSKVEEKGASKSISTTTWNEPTPAKNSPPQLNQGVNLAQFQPSSSPLLATTAWTASGEAFLNQPPQYPSQWLEERTRLQSPEPDMTSASTFKESKEESQNKTGQTIRRLPIEDLLAQDSKEVSPAANEAQDVPAARQVTPVRPMKRPFDAVFNETEASSSGDNHTTTTATRRAILQRYTRPDGSRAFRPAHYNSPVCASTALLAKETAEDEGTSTSPASRQRSPPVKLGSLVQHPNTKPAKRRRLAQVAACAFGTVLGGAAVLAGMIATAPSI